MVSMITQMYNILQSGKFVFRIKKYTVKAVKSLGRIIPISTSYTVSTCMYICLVRDIK